MGLTAKEKARRARERKAAAKARRESERRWKAACEKWGPPDGREQKNELGRTLRLKDKILKRGTMSEPIKRTSSTRNVPLMHRFVKLRAALEKLEEDRTNRELGTEARKHLRAIAKGVESQVKPLDRRRLELGGRVTVPPEKGKVRRRAGVLRGFDGKRATVTVKGETLTFKLQDVRKAR